MRNCFHYINTFFMHEKKEESGGHTSTATARRTKNNYDATLYVEETLSQ